MTSIKLGVFHAARDNVKPDPRVYEAVCKALRPADSYRAKEGDAALLVSTLNKLTDATYAKHFEAIRGAILEGSMCHRDVVRLVLQQSLRLPSSIPVYARFVRDLCAEWPDAVFSVHDFVDSFADTAKRIAETVLPADDEYDKFCEVTKKKAMFVASGSLLGALHGSGVASFSLDDVIAVAFSHAEGATHFGVEAIAEWAGSVGRVARAHRDALVSRLNALPHKDLPFKLRFKIEKAVKDISTFQ
jgi:hypothetical protein